MIPYKEIHIVSYGYRDKDDLWKIGAAIAVSYNNKEMNYQAPWILDYVDKNLEPTPFHKAFISSVRCAISIVTEHLKKNNCQFIKKCIRKNHLYSFKIIK